MLKPEQVPEAVTQKVKELVIEMGFLGSPIRDFEAREIVTAAINAWPGMRNLVDGIGRPLRLVLPHVDCPPNRLER